MVQTRAANHEEWVKVTLGLTILIGFVLRLIPGWMAGFPLNDGGMFLVMLRELKANHFLIPAFTSYNYSNIPYAYPPFGFYAGALLSILGIPDLEILRWLPAIVNGLTIPAFFWLAETLLEDRPRAALATIFYALTPAYGWEIMGGGLTRSFGALFMLLALLFSVKSFKTGLWKFVFPASIFAGLSILSHPQTAIHAAFGIAFFWLFTKHSWRKLAQAFGLAILAGIVSAPWWLVVYLQHGVGPFLSAAGSGVHDVFPLTAFFSDLFGRDTFIPILLILRLAGILWEGAHRRFRFVLWAAIPYFFDQRSAGTTSFLAFSLLCAIGLADALPFIVTWIIKRTQPAIDIVRLRWFNTTLIAIAFYLFGECGIYSYVLVNTSLHTPEPFQTMGWVSRNTSPQSRFLLLTGSPGIMSDPIQEWFPALAGRRSQTTMQGLEWTLDKDFFPRLRSMISLQGCTTLACVNAWSANTGLSCDYLWVQKSNAELPLLNSIKMDGGYIQVYDNSTTAVFKKQ